MDLLGEVVLLLEVERPGDLDGRDLLLLSPKNGRLGGDLDGDLLLVLGLSSRGCQGSCLPLVPLRVVLRPEALCLNLGIQLADSCSCGRY